MKSLFALLTRHWLLAGLTLLAMLLAGALAFIYSGIYNVAATGQHTRPVFWLTNTVMRHSIANRAKELQAPPLGAPEQIERGLELYVAHCEQCHGGPGVAPQPFALGLTPIPANLVETARRWPASHIFWSAKYGIKMTGMPAWQYRLDDGQLWDLVAFIEHLAQLTPRDYQTQRRSVARRPGGQVQQP